METNILNQLDANQINFVCILVAMTQTNINALTSMITWCIAEAIWNVKVICAQNSLTRQMFAMGAFLI